MEKEFLLGMTNGQREEIRNREYRHGLVSAQIEIDLPLQLRALRKQRGWTQPQLAERTGMKQSRFPVMEKPGGANFTLETLRRLAEAFDVALIVRFAPFSELLGWSETFDPENFNAPSFEEEFDLEQQASVNQATGAERLLQLVEQIQALQGAWKAQQPTPIDSTPLYARNIMSTPGSIGRLMRKPAGAEGQASSMAQAK